LKDAFSYDMIKKNITLGEYMKKYIISIDQGTSSTRAIVFNKKGEVISQAQKEVPVMYPQEHYVEQNPYLIWNSVLTTLAQALLEKEIMPQEIASIGITNQRETTVLWSRKTGKVVHDAIVWQSKQSTEICNRYESQKELIQSKTGLVLDSYFSASKIIWILEHSEEARNLMSTGDLMFGTIDTWLLYKLSGGEVHKTDATNASRTMIYNIYEHKWDQELLDLFGIDASILPTVEDSNALFGHTAKHVFFGHKIPVTGVLGDQQAALFGQLCLEEGMIKNTYGTGCFMLMNTGTKPKKSTKGLLTTIGYQMDGVATYALEGSVFVAGSAIQWLRDEMKFFDNASKSEALATSVESSEGVIVVPSFVGLGTPYWNATVQGAMFGLKRSTSQANITRATLEALAFQSRDIIDVMREESNIEVKLLKVDGGASQNNYLMQFQSDILATPIIRPKMLESTALGAAYISGLKSGFFKSVEEIQQLVEEDQIFTPVLDETTRNSRYQKWQKAIDAVIRFHTR
jgi:glycerol kinase